ncbi:deoxynucleoside kinase [Mycoplasma sp. 1018B]|uniref:deoxynucleoside kinase n=1 Tax=Mycoplasma sp. 1018B TaxID=2967302 RepID=UPI00211C20F1|nr:deoxynucleoside kinase [Mycoplasma sp. 1018B]UUM19035.1 deoxynucleoside kinase [Mycoplasma sp. 1018B]
MIIAISGMIAAGKSTLSQKLHQIYSNSLLMEEFDNNDLVFNTFLKWLYENKKNINIAFQTYILENLQNKIQKIANDYKRNKNNFLFLDRFNLEHYIFAVATLSYKNKRYLEAFDKMFHEIINLNHNPDLAIFLDISFETFLERLKNRDRKSEVNNLNSNIEYFKLLHEIYKDLFISLVTKYKIPYVIIQADNKNSETILAEVIKNLESKINNL